MGLSWKLAQLGRVFLGGHRSCCRGRGCATALKKSDKTSTYSLRHRRENSSDASVHQAELRTPPHGSQRVWSRLHFLRASQSIPSVWHLCGAGAACLQDVGLEHSALSCVPFCSQPGLGPGGRTVTAVCRASCMDVGFLFWKRFCSLIYSTLEREKAIFLSALRNIRHSMEIQLSYEGIRQKLTPNTDSMHI